MHKGMIWKIKFANYFEIFVDPTQQMIWEIRTGINFESHIKGQNEGSVQEDLLKYVHVIRFTSE